MAAVSDFGFGGAVNVGLPLLSSARGWGAAGIGIVLGGFGLGASLTALTLVLRPPHPPRRPVVRTTSRTHGRRSGRHGLAAISLAHRRLRAVLGIGSGFVGSLFSSVLLTQTPPALIGRV